MNFNQSLLERKNYIDSYIADYWKQLTWPDLVGLQELKKSIEYSVLNGGKRFRPVLSLLIAESFGVHPKQILPMATAIEFIHTYSLIHDDLFCMDNDDFRRGQPTNHKVFSESTALLAGDALLTEAFLVIANGYSHSPQLIGPLVRLLSLAAGPFGMVGGQVVDLQAQKNKLDLNLNQLKQMHAMKTGALIRVSCESSGLVCGLPAEKNQLLKEFGEWLGVAFQIADDILDAQEKEEVGSYVSNLGLEGSKKELEFFTQQSLQILDELNLTNSLLSELVRYNKSRQ
jgi:geranylgeranyl diphosphate synthase type II